MLVVKNLTLRRYLNFSKFKLMGKGDKRSKRGKIWRGSNGKSRPKNSKLDSSKNSGKSGS